MKKQYNTPAIRIIITESTPLMAGSDLSMGTESDGVANSKGMQFNFDDKEEEYDY